MSDGTHAAAATDTVRDFSELSRVDVVYAGGKGANLGELTAAGFPVPSGFVVGAAAYAAFAEASTNQLHADVPLQQWCW